MKQEKPAVLLAKQGKIAIVTLNRPEAANAHSRAMGNALREIWQDIKQDDDIHVAILTGAGERHFCAGIDVREVARGWDPAEQEGGARWGDIPEDFWKPVFCAVNGVVAGGGWHFLWQSDFAIATDNATFLEPHVSIGWLPLREMMGLANRAPLSVVMRMALVGNTERMTAQRAYELGIVTELVSQEQLLPRALEIAENIARQGTQSVRAIKEVLHRAYELRFVPHQREAFLYGDLLRSAVLHRSQDHKEGPKAWAEKRAPQWQGR